MAKAQVLHSSTIIMSDISLKSQSYRFSVAPMMDWSESSGFSTV
ncbi:MULTISPECIES: hypothetical protein [unclassified Bradyrhizobium]|nr:MULTISPECIES: hypothetical protein [unclassified Bradyrhizobium]